ncbi:hypothetical protein LOY42_01650 [Pseudomonas sp. B21-023]|uniref:hypothetical protein n=1 Tax=unclassified Pseudomonas TaxID=196821 RepID=UPI0011192386|nr:MULTISPECIES: hypothetical protein [unclassified Pseudomonas]UVL19669.1 hypothetical protein LOY44_01775 [Pseudomonas sp. B21-044]UVM17052.1 hypothetical protein LOY42_01650 [Pseudomonas sp. B21-023]
MKGSMFRGVAWATGIVSLSLLSLASAFAGEISRLAELEPPVDRRTLEQAQFTGREGLKVLLDNPAGQSIQLMRAHPTIVNESTQLLAMPLADGRVLKFRLRNYTAPEPSDNSGVAGGEYTPAAYWFGEGVLDDEPRATVTSKDTFAASNFIFLARRGDSLRGRMVVNGKLYLLENAGNGQHGLMEVNEAQGLPCLLVDDATVKQADIAKASLPRPASQREHEIHVLLLTTWRTSQMTNPSAFDIMTDEIMFFSQVSDQGDGLSLKLKVVHRLATNAADGLLSQGEKILDDFRNGKTAATSGVARLREQYKADVVIVGGEFVPAKAVTYKSIRPENAYYVFAMHGPQYFLHSFGHLMGLRDGWKPGGPGLIPPYQFGFLSKEYNSKQYASIGFDLKDCPEEAECETVYRWSDPDVNLEFGRFGDPEYSNEIRRLNERAAEIKNYY